MSKYFIQQISFDGTYAVMYRGTYVTMEVFRGSKYECEMHLIALSKNDFINLLK